MRVLLEKFSNTGLKHKSFANCERVLHLHMLKLYSRSLPLNTVNANFFILRKKVIGKNVDKINLWKISLFIRSSSFRKQ